MHEWYYGWWWRPKRMTRKQIKEMVDNMKRTNVIHEKSRKYHETEELEAEDILKKLDEEQLNSNFNN